MKPLPAALAALLLFAAPFSPATPVKLEAGHDEIYENTVLQNADGDWKYCIRITTLPGALYTLQESPDLGISEPWTNVETFYGSGAEWIVPVMDAQPPVDTPTGPPPLPSAATPPVPAAFFMMEKTTTGGLLLSWKSLDDGQPKRKVLDGVTLDPAWDSFHAPYFNRHGGWFYSLCPQLTAPVDFQGETYTPGPLDAALLANFTAALPAITANIQASVTAAARASSQPPAPTTGNKRFYRIKADYSVDSAGRGTPDWVLFANGMNPFQTATNSGDSGTTTDPYENLDPLADADNDGIKNGDDAVPDDPQINWPSLQKHRYIWLPVATQTQDGYPFNGGETSQPSPDNQPLAVNKSGHVLFTRSIWEKNTMTALPTPSQIASLLCENQPVTYTRTIGKATGINDDGWIGGISAFYDAGSVTYYDGLLWKRHDDPPHYRSPSVHSAVSSVVTPDECIKQTGGIGSDGSVSCLAFIFGNGDYLGTFHDGSRWFSAARFNPEGNFAIPCASLDATRNLWLIRTGLEPNGTGGRYDLYLRQGSTLVPLVENVLPGTGTPESKANAYGISRAPTHPPPGGGPPEERLWIAAGAEVKLEKHAATATDRWHIPPSMAQGARRVNRRGEAITESAYWVNGSYTPLKEILGTALGLHAWQWDTTLAAIAGIDLASDGTILLEATINGTRKTGLLVPVEVRWEEIGAFTDSSGTAVESFENIDIHIDPWTGIPNGKRLFPGSKNPDKTTLRNAVNVVVKTSPALAGKTIKVRAYDVDDSTSETIDYNIPEDTTSGRCIDKNGKAGDDNFDDYLGTKKTGNFSGAGSSTMNEKTATLDPNGEARFPFYTGMQPGNNYKVAVLEVDGNSFPAPQTTVAANADYLGYLPKHTSRAPSTELLTIWRKLWVENDSMMEISKGTDDNPLNDLHQTAEPPVVKSVSYDSTTDRTCIGIPEPADISSFTDLENGNIKIQGIIHKVVATDYTDSWFEDFRVYIQGDHSAIPVHSGFRLYDDDDYGLTGAPLPRHDLVTELMKSYFRPGFIEVEDAAAYNASPDVLFQANDNLQTYQTSVHMAKNLFDNEKLWVAHLVAGYQFAMSEDIDPGESNRNGEAPTFGATKTTNNNDISIVFVESCRDAYDYSIRLSDNGGNLIHKIDSLIKLTQFISSIGAHEIGHQPGSLSGDQEHAEDSLMRADGGSVNSPGNELFSAKSLLRFRKSLNWSKK